MEYIKDFDFYKDIANKTDNVSLLSPVTVIDKGKPVQCSIFTEYWRLRGSLKVYSGDNNKLLTDYMKENNIDYYSFNDKANGNDWMNYYLQHGKSLGKIISLVKNVYIRDLGNLFTEETLINIFIAHTVYQTFMGTSNMCYLLQKYINKDLYYVDNAIGDKDSADLDSPYGIDVIVKSKDTNKIVKLLQVKPFTFFVKSKVYDDGLNEDRKSAFDHQGKIDELYKSYINLFTDKESSELLYVVYNDKDKDYVQYYINKKTRKFGHKLTDLLGKCTIEEAKNYNGYTYYYKNGYLNKQCDLIPII